MIHRVLIIISALVLVSQAQQSGNLNKNILSFLKSNNMGSTFVQLLERVAQQAQDQTVIQALGGTGSNRVLPTDNSGQTGGYTVFVPINSALNGVQINDQTIYDIRNDLYNLVMKRRISMEQLKQQNDGMNVTESMTFGFQPRLQMRMVTNFYNRQFDETTSTSNTNSRKKRQFQPNRPNNNQNTQNNNQNSVNNPSDDNSPFSQNGQKKQNNQNTQNKQFPNNNMNQNGQVNMNGQQKIDSDSELNMYEQYEEIYGKQPTYQGPPISPKLPQDELYLINNAIILDRFELTNGIVYFIDAYPQYYDKSLYVLSKDNEVNGLRQNINSWINKADQSFTQGNENLKNALNAYGPNTFFLPTDQSFNKFTDRQLLNNDTFLVDMVLKSHRISNQILFDYYLDNPKVTYMTDANLPVSTRHRYVNNKIEIEVSIGHVKGKILPEFRNIYCASGVIHLIDTILGVPTESAYKRIAANPQLATLRTLIDASSYRQALDSQSNPNWDLNLNNNNNQNNNNQNTNSKQYTILAPNEFALLAIKDELLQNKTALDEFLSTHIITDPSNKVFFTDHDVSVFTNGRTYQTMNEKQSLIANVQLDPDGVSNNVVLSLQSNPSIRATIVNGNDLVSNGVIHIVDKPLTLFTTSDITGLLEKYSTMNGPGQPAFNQFVDALRSTGIFNDLKQPSKQYTLFIPTNEALSKYQDIMKGNDQEKKKQLIYRHICIDQNLLSKNLASNSTQSQTSQPQEGQLICRNALGQDLTLTKDAYGLISKWQGMASSKIVNDFPGVFSSAYILDTPLLNHNLPNLGLHKYNSAIGVESSMFVMFVSVIFARLF